MSSMLNIGNPRMEASMGPGTSNMGQEGRIPQRSSKDHKGETKIQRNHEGCLTWKWLIRDVQSSDFNLVSLLVSISGFDVGITRNQVSTLIEPGSKRRKLFS